MLLSSCPVGGLRTWEDEGSLGASRSWCSSCGASLPLPLPVASESLPDALSASTDLLRFRVGGIAQDRGTEAKEQREREDGPRASKFALQNARRRRSDALHRLWQTDAQNASTRQTRTRRVQPSSDSPLPPSSRWTLPPARRPQNRNSSRRYSDR